MAFSVDKRKFLKTNLNLERLNVSQKTFTFYSYFSEKCNNLSKKMKSVALSNHTA